MSFSFKSVQGDASNIEVALSTSIQHDREDEVTSAVEKAIAEIVESLGGYVSVSAYGHVNPAEGESGDTVYINIMSVPVPGGESPEVDPTAAPLASAETPLMTTDEALAISSGQANPGGTVAPAAGSVAPMSAGNTPGLETAPATSTIVDHPPFSDSPDAPGQIDQNGDPVRAQPAQPQAAAQAVADDPTLGTTAGVQEAQDTEASAAAEAQQQEEAAPDVPVVPVSDPETGEVPQPEGVQDDGTPVGGEPVPAAEPEAPLSDPPAVVADPVTNEVQSPVAPPVEGWVDPAAVDAVPGDNPAPADSIAPVIGDPSAPVAPVDPVSTPDPLVTPAIAPDEASPPAEPASPETPAADSTV